MPAPFVPWSLEHLVVIALTFVVPVALGWWARRDPGRRRARIIAHVFALVLAVQLVANLVLVGLEQKLHWSEFMPLHLCHLALFASIAACWTDNAWCYELAYFWGLGGTLQGMLTPGLWVGFPALECILFFLGHSGIVACVIFLTIGFQRRPRWVSVGHAYLAILGYAVVAGAFNAIFGTNYGFLREKPPTASLFDWLGPWPWYIVTSAALAGVVFVLLYAPWALADRLRRRRRRLD
jgi:hypothetical integral membrane protein (TIGR02206 family)